MVFLSQVEEEIRFQLSLNIAKRVLIKDGTIRNVVPDLGKMLRDYSNYGDADNFLDGAGVHSPNRQVFSKMSASLSFLLL